jgi:hypothetical protein
MSFTSAERKRLDGLLRLAAESPFDGERANARAAAVRIAVRHGMSLEEAAAACGSLWPSARPNQSRPRAAAPTSEVAWFFHLTDVAIRLAKERRAAALARARALGLEVDEAPRERSHGRRDRVAWVSRRSLDPREHARVLLTETSLRLHDIVGITGLDVYQVVGLKLSLRPIPAHQQV